MASMASGRIPPEEMAELTVVKPLGSTKMQGLAFAAEGAEVMEQNEGERVGFVLTSGNWGRL